MSLTTIYQIICLIGHPTCFHPLICIFILLDQLLRVALHPWFLCTLAFAWWLFCCGRILPSKVSFEIAWTTKTHPWKYHKKLLCMECNAFCKDSTSLQGMCYQVYVTDTAQTVSNLVRRTIFRKETKHF